MSEGSSDYEFRSVLLQSERLSSDVELKNMVTDLDIYEHIQKPYLTAKILLLDNEDLLDEADILGGERISISIISKRDDCIPFTNHFRITNIISTEKVNDNIQTAAFQLIEEHAYISNLLNINKYYSGNTTSIIKKICENYIDKKLVGDNSKQNIKAIVPNMSPLTAIEWFSRKSTSTRGYPYYVYSTLTKDSLFMNDLGTMLSSPVLNDDVPYTNSSMSAQGKNSDVRRRSILQHNFSDNMENLYLKIAQGVIGARYEYIDTINDKQKAVNFDIVKDLYKNLIDDGVMQPNQSNYSFSEKYVHNNKSFNKIQSNTFTFVRGSGAFRETDEDEYSVSYSERKTTAEYKLEVISKAFDSMLKKNPMSITVPGVDFIDGDRHSTIGNNIRVQFLVTTPEKDPGEKVFDAKKSGDYLIFSTRHMFKKETYDIALTCLKIGNLRR